MRFLKKFVRTKDAGNEQSTGKICPTCGQSNPLNVKFCSSCGSEFVFVCDKFDAFISYRRETGSDLASLLKIQLENRFNKKIFLDINELQVGRFDEELLRRIEETPNFVVILSKTSLDRCTNKSDWLKREIVHAIKTARNIIPVLTEGFNFPSYEVWALLPSEMRILSALNGITYSHIHQDSAIRRIASYMKTDAEIHKNQGISDTEIVKHSSQNDSSQKSEADSLIAQSKINKPVIEVKVKDGVQPNTSSKKENPKMAADLKINTENFLFLHRASSFNIGTKDSKNMSFLYYPGTLVQYSKKGIDGNSPWYQFSGINGTDIWLLGYMASEAKNDDKRVFFKIEENGHVGYLAEIGVRESIEQILILDDILGATQIKIDQIISMSAKKDEMSVKTQDIGVFSGGLQKWANYNYYNHESHIMGPCLITQDAVIALIRTNRTNAFTINRANKKERPSLMPDSIYWNRTQLKFRLTARAAIGHFDESIRSQYINFTEQSLGWIGIKIPQIKRLTVDSEGKETPVVVETFAGNVFRGVCKEKFNLSGTMISLDSVKNIVLEAFEMVSI